MKRNTTQSKLPTYFCKTQKLNFETVTVNEIINLNIIGAKETDKIVDDDSLTECSQHERIDPMDIGNFTGKVLPDELKLRILNSCWKPDEKFNFPSVKCGNQNRKFQLSWIHQHFWLTYSNIFKGGFCIYCVLFASKVISIGSQEILAFVTKPFQTLQKSFKITEHATKNYHITALEKAGYFKKIMCGQEKPVSEQVNTQILKLIEENKRRLAPIVKTILFCARNNLPLRGHRDDGEFVYSCPEQEIPQREQEGLFRTLLQFRIESGDEDLKYHFKNIKGNCTMISKSIQNEIIDCVGDVIKNKIISKVQKSKYFTILLDETTDISKKEQLSVSIRYVNLDQLQLQEDFLEFVLVKDTTGKGLKETLKSILSDYGLLFENLRGQGYDGGSNMAGKFNGLQALIMAENPKALYCHCFNHSLNLVISNACDVDDMANMFRTLAFACNFFSSSKRNEALKEAIECCSSITSRKKTLKSLCTTRWVERHESVLVFKELFPCVFRALEKIETWEDKEVSSKATILQSTLKDFKFIVALEIAAEILAVTLPVSKFLQDPTLDFSAAKNIIEDTKGVFVKMRKNSDSVFNTIFQSSVFQARSVKEIVQIPRTVETQKYRSNAPAKTPEDYFRINVFNPFLDHMISELNTRFNDRFSTVIPIQALIPAYVDKHDVNTILSAAKMYETDLPCSLLELKGQILLWKHEWTNNSNAPTTAMEAMKFAEGKFPGIFILLQIFATLPVTTSTPERSFSRLKLIKSYLRSTMTQSRLSGLALASIHKDISVSTDEIISLFALRKPRRMQLANWDSIENE